jgi:hypothetical protein
MVLQERHSRIVRADGIQPEPSYRLKFAKPHGGQPLDVGRINVPRCRYSLIFNRLRDTNRRSSPDARTSENRHIHTQVSEQGTKD